MSEPLFGFIDANKRAILRALSLAMQNPMELIKPSPEAFAETAAEKQSRLMQQVQDPATRERALAELAGPSSEVAQQAMSNFGPAGKWTTGPQTAGALLDKYQSLKALTTQETAQLTYLWAKAKGFPQDIIDALIIDSNQASAHKLDAQTLLNMYQKVSHHMTETPFEEILQGQSTGMGEIAKNYAAAEAKWSTAADKIGAELPKIEMPTPTPQSTLDVAMRNSPAVKEMESSHGIPYEDLQRIGRYTGESAQEILERFDQARQNAVDMLGLPENNTHVDRAIAMGYADPSKPENYFWRGSYTPRSTLEAPAVREPSTRTSGRDQYIFMSLPARLGGGTAYRGFGEVHTPYVSSLDPHSLFFDTAKQEHIEDLITSLVNRESLSPSTEAHLKNIRANPEWRDWGDLEQRGITEGIRQANFPGILTQEAGTNIGTFHPEAMRHPVAAFDPMYMFSPNNFSSWAPVGAISGLAALLAGQQDQSPPQ